MLQMMVPWKLFVVGEIGQHGIGAAPGNGELDRAFAQSFFQFIEIEIEQGARVADDDDRLRRHAPARLHPEVVGVVQGGSVADGADIKFPGRGRRR